MTTPKPTIALAGATGALGAHVLQALLSASYPVIALIRSTSSSTSSLPKHPLLTLAPIDYSDPTTLTPYLTKTPIVISTLGSLALATEQTALIEAASTAGVKRFIPSEFGCDISNPLAATLPVFGYKIAARKLLESKAKNNPEFSYTYFINNMFLDWGLNNGFILSGDMTAHTTTVMDGGNRPAAGMTLPSVAKALVAMLDHLDETKNRSVVVNEAQLTQRELIELAKEVDGKEWEISEGSTKEIREGGYKALQEGGDIGKAMVGFLYSGIWADGYGGDWTGKKTDNELLGVKQLSREEVKAVVAQALK